LPPDLVARLVELPAVRLAAFREPDGGVRVVSKDGIARLFEGEGTIAYEPVKGDAIGLGADGIVAADREMLRLSRSTELPDAPAQLLQLFRSPRAGDIVLAADKGFDLRKRWENPEHRAGHGSLIADHMNVPVFTSQPLPDEPIRTVDLMPFMLESLGISPPQGIDGVLPGRLAAVSAQHPGATDRT
jgi:hypothetical protein